MPAPSGRENLLITKPLTEAACTYRLQEMVSELSEFFCRFILKNDREYLNSNSFLFSYFSEKNIIDKEGKVNEKNLENHCRLVALILLIQQTSKYWIKNKFENEQALLSSLDDAYQKLPPGFKACLHEFSEIIEKDLLEKNLNDLIDIFNFPSDIIGIVYNKFSYNSHQQSHGQHFTQSDEADILNAFCIGKNTLSVLDPSCGSGMFLTRAFYFFKYFHPEETMTGQIKGIDVSPYSTYLTFINLFFRRKCENKNVAETFTNNFLKINNNDVLPVDACVGNPPFIRHELIDDKTEWIQLIKKEYSISYVNGQSDLYIYFLIHAASFLKEGARLGWVISASWLDVQFGGGLQRFLLEHFKIIAIIDYQAKRSFETASVNTILLVIEKSEHEKERKNHLVKFVRLYCEYEKLIGEIHSASRITSAIEFAKNIEAINENVCNENMRVTLARQIILENDSSVDGKYFNGYWGAKYFRSPKIYDKIILNSGDQFFSLSHFAEVKYGVKTGANDFFYLIDETHKALAFGEKEYENIFGDSKASHQQIWNTCGWFLSGLDNKHFIIEKEFVQPVFKTQKEADNLEVKISKLKFSVLNCKVPKDELKKENKRVLDYINFAEKEYNIQKRPSVSGRNLWYDLSSSFAKGDFIFPSKIGEKYRLIDNRKAKVVCDKVNYVIRIKDEFKQYADALFLILNSIYFRYFIDLFSRQLTGNQTLSDVDVNLLKKTKIPHPGIFEKNKTDVASIIKKLKSREQLPLSKETLQKDKFEIDAVVLGCIGLDENDVKELYREASAYVEKRQLKSDSLQK
ncbi:MAG TPA: N-6 DNA methylase [Hanamia sp.]|nr:N-6 DNA methylase [Hanamia sp.]